MNEFRKAQRDYYSWKIKQAQNRSKNQWHIINEIMGKDKCITYPEVPLKNEESIKDENQLANAFNHYFSNIGCELAQKIPNTTINFLDYMKPSNENSMFLEPVCIQEIITVMNSIKTNAAGADNISKQIIKHNFHTIAKHLLKIINQSFTLGIVPNELKIAKIIPFYKSGDKNTLGNYRPVAILPLFSKIWEKLYYDRLMKFLDRHNILYTHQYGFRPKYSIDYAVMSLQNYIIKEFEKGNYTIGIFLDLSKAFDTLDKNLLLNKLHRYGLRGIPNKWINSYLSDRNQQVQLRNILSDKNFIDTGVPQGSVLGPVMFLLYVNDLPNFDNKVFTLMFADDNSLFISGPNLDELMHQTKK